MNNIEPISVASTRATDILINQSGYVFSRQPGGPIMFIEKALSDAGVPYRSFCGDPIDVEILVTDDGEFGKVPIKPTPQLISELALSKWTIVSGILNEWALPQGADLPERLCIDLQGFVRDGDDFGKKRIWNEIGGVAGKIFCVKGTEGEVGYLPEAVRDDQKNRLLVATKGASGSDVFYKGSHTFVPAEAVEGLPDTIGAGDTFFAYLVAAMYQGEEPQQAALRATHKTAQFLRRKLVI